jgi:glycosyltransferase involved in cell wall biosynthesis
MHLQAWDVACIPPWPFRSHHADPVVEQTLVCGTKPRGSFIGIKLMIPDPCSVATFFGRPRIFYTLSEVDRIPPDWVKMLNTVDQVWTASAWGRDVFVESGVKRPVRVVPEGVDSSVFKPQRVRTNGAHYRFLAVGKMEERKNYQLLFRAYVEEFRPDEPVELVVHFGHVIDPSRLLSKLGLPGRHARITVSPPILTREKMVELYQSAHAFVLPTRGEGWGLPIIEAMACGLPVVTTGIGPILEYSSRATALLLDYKLIPARDPQFDEYFQWGRWAEPDLEQLRYFMRWLFENPLAGRELGWRAAEQIRTNWTWGNAVQKIEQALEA